MRVRCPHCHNPVEILDDASFEDIVCSTCGSSFSLVGDGDETETFRRAAKTIGHFQLVEQLGVGAFGTVWKANDTQLDRSVAVKIPRKNLLDDPETEQFLREARAAAQLQHANIVAVHEVGKHDDSIYIVSDYVEGADLKQWMGGQPLPPRNAAEICAIVAEALQHSHEQGVVHRDVKPSNILLDLRGQPHITDFGLAKRDYGEITMTVEGVILGTPAYMSPEQARGEGHAADRRSDVYSLGVVLFEMLTGELPFRGENRMLLVQILKDEPPTPRRLNRQVPSDLETICLKCLAKEPGKRYATARDLADDLYRHLRGAPIQARPTSQLERVWKWCKRNRARAGLAAVTLMLILLLGVGGPLIAIQQQRILVKAAVANVNSLRTAAPESVPFLIDTLRPVSSRVQPILQGLFRDKDCDATHRLRAAMALMQIRAPSAKLVEYVVRQVPHVRAAECPNIVASLANDRERALYSLKTAIASAQQLEDWRAKARLSIVALHLQDAEAAADMLEFEARSDPIQRTVFIETFRNWHGDLTTLSHTVARTNHGALRSGICLSVGNVGDVSGEVRFSWKAVFEDWYLNQGDAGTHSAAAWALRKWELGIPEVVATMDLRGARNWLVTPSGLTMLRIPAGEFVRQAGAPENRLEQTVRVTEDFFLCDREVTVRLFQQFINDADYVGDKPEDGEIDFEQVSQISPTPMHPVLHVNWFDAVMFCNWLSRREGRSPCYKQGKRQIAFGKPLKKRYLWRLIAEADGYHLPSEAQWEYACRAGTKTTYAFGEDESRLMDFGTYLVNSHSRASANGSKMCNAWGLFDMHGNVMEWCSDWYGSFGEEAIVVDPLAIGERTYSFRVCRNGSWNSTAETCKASSRRRYNPETRSRYVGFRVALGPFDSDSSSGAEHGSHEPNQAEVEP